MTEFTPPQVATPDDMKNQPEEFQDLVRKIVVSHAINELYGAPGVRRAGDRVCADAVRQVADLPRRHGGVRPSRALQGARVTSSASRASR